MASLLSITAVGYFKIAMTLTIPITLILDPFIAPTYTEISRTIAEFQWGTTLRLLKRVTMITGGVVLAIWTAWALTGWWIIPTVYKPQASPVYPLLLILVAGYGFASTFQWNRSLFLSLGKAGYPVLITLLTGIVELALDILPGAALWIPDDGGYPLRLFHCLPGFHHLARLVGNPSPGESRPKTPRSGYASVQGG